MKTRSIIAAGLIATAISTGIAGLGSTAVANASVKHCGWGMVLDTQGGVTACKPLPVTPGHRGHKQRHHILATQH